MAKASANAKTAKKKRSRRYLKKSVRWTTAGLLMATAVIIALIPVQSGGVSATNNATVAVTPSIEDVVDDSKSYGITTRTDLSVTASDADGSGGKWKGFPLKLASEINSTEADLSVLTPGTDKPAAAVVRISDDVNYEYHLREWADDTTNCDSDLAINREFYVLSDNLPNSDDKSIYELQKKASDADSIYKYVGSANIYQCAGDVPMADGSIGYSTQAWGSTASTPGQYEYRVLTVTVKEDELDADGNPTGNKIVKYTKDYKVCQKVATITYICDNAFKVDTSSESTIKATLANIKTVTIPGTMRAIGNNAFDGQTYLEQVHGGDLLDTIGESAFKNCSSIKRVDFVDNSPLRIIGDGAFAYNTALDDFIIPKAIQTIGSGAFYGCENFNDIDSDATEDKQSTLFSVTSTGDQTFRIGSYVFAKCNNLKNIALDKDILEIGEGIFAECPNLYSVVMPRTTAAAYPANTFSNDRKLHYVRIPDHSSGSYPHYFANSSENTNIPCIFVNKTNQKQNSPLYNPETNPNALEAITCEDELFAIWGPINTVQSKIHDYAAKYGITYMFEDEAGTIHYELTLNGYTFEFTQDGTILTGAPTTALGVDAGETLEIPDSIGGVAITGIADGAFKDLNATNGNPKNILIPDTVKTIGKEAFYNCANISYVGISTQGVAIGEKAFAGNTNLGTVAFTQTTETGDTTIGASCFEGDTKLNLVSFRNTDINEDNINVVNVAAIGDKAFYTGNNAGLTIRGKMEPGYAPFDFAINPNNRTSAGSDSYIKYETGNPDNLECKYDKNIQKVSLTKYPCADTVVGKDAAGNPVKIHNLEEKLAKYNATGNPDDMPSVMEEYIIDRYKNINVPAGIETITNAKAIDNNTIILMSNLNEPANQQHDVNGVLTDCNNAHALETLQFHGIKDIPAHACENDDNLKDARIKGEIENIGAYAFNDCDKLQTLVIGDASGGTPLPIHNIDEYAFADCDNLSAVQIDGNLCDPALPSTAFLNCKNLQHIDFRGEGDKSAASVDDPYYWVEDGVVYEYDGENTILVCGLPGVEAVTVSGDIDKINEKAFENCDRLVSVDMSACEKIDTIPDKCFYDCNLLTSVILPKTCDSIYDKAFAFENPTNVGNLDIIMPAHEIFIMDNAFDNRVNPVNPDAAHTNIHSYDNSAAERYTKKFGTKVKFTKDQYDDVIIRFIYYVDNEVVIDEMTVPYNTTPDPLPTVPADGRTGYKFTGLWDNTITPAIAFKQYRAVYEPVESEGGSSGSSASASSSAASGSTSSGSTTSGSGSSTNKGSSSSSASSSSARPVVISGAPAPLGMLATSSSANAAATVSSTDTTKGSDVSKGNTNVVNNAPGIGDSSQISATVNGSSDNYVIKLSETTESDNYAKDALGATFGSLDNIKYMPFDISLYDSTGTQLISPIPAGTSVSVTMPIPDDLVKYGGNCKVASTVDGRLEVMPVKFTVIDGVPCINFTTSHLSPYVVYVDTANLTSSGNLDATPKTGDPIHPKWFLVIGLAAMSIFLFLKRDREMVSMAQ